MKDLSTLKRTRFESKADIVTSKRVKREAIASVISNENDLSGLRAMLPDQETIDANSDVLFFTANLAVANCANLNGDGVLTDGMIELAKTLPFKQINAEHQREYQKDGSGGMIGCIVSAGFSSYPDNKLMTEEEAKQCKGKFNLVVTGALWKLAGDIYQIIEQSSVPSSQYYKAVSVSWELGFSEHAVATNSDFTQGSLIYGEMAQSYSKYFKAEGGAGIDDKGNPVYRVILDGLGLGLGMVTNPAADVKGLITSETFSEETEMPETPEVEPEEPEMEDPESEDEKPTIKIEIEIEAADNKGKTLNKPFRLPSGSNKKFGVYVKNDKGNVVMVKFGDPNMEIKRDDPDRRKAYRSRHGCDTNPGPKWKANYWSCRMWSSKPVSSIASILESEAEWDGETEFSLDEILSICPEYKEIQAVEEEIEENVKINEKNISISKTLPVTTIRPPMKFSNLKEIYAHLESETPEISNAKDMRDFLVAEFTKANELYEASQNEKAEAERKLQESIADSQASKTELEALKAKVDQMEAQAREKETQDVFDSRMTALAAEYDIEDAKVRKFITEQIRELDEDGYQFWLANAGEIVLASRIKQKTPVNIEEATASLKEATASVDIPNSQDLSDKPELSFLALAKEINYKK